MEIEVAASVRSFTVTDCDHKEILLSAMEDSKNILKYWNIIFAILTCLIILPSLIKMTKRKIENINKR